MYYLVRFFITVLFSLLIQLLPVTFSNVSLTRPVTVGIAAGAGTEEATPSPAPPGEVLLCGLETDWPSHEITRDVSKDNC